MQDVGKVDLRYYSLNDGKNLSTDQRQELHQLHQNQNREWWKRGCGQWTECLKYKALKARLSTLEAHSKKALNGKNDSEDESQLFDGKESHTFSSCHYRGHSKLDHKTSTHQKGESSWLLRSSERDDWPGVSDHGEAHHCSIFKHRLQTYNRAKHAYTHIVGDKCLVVHDHDRLINVFGYDPTHGHRCTQMVDATVRCNDPITCYP